MFKKITTIVSLSALTVSCSDGAEYVIQKTKSNNDLQTGYLKIDGQRKQFQYKVEGDFAVIDECTRVPLTELVKEKDPQLGLTSLEGVYLWPNAIVPYSIRNPTPGFKNKFMNRAEAEFKRAGILLVPRTTEGHYLDIQLVFYGTPECESLRCQNFAGMANTFGYAPRTRTDWFYGNKTPPNDGNSVYLACSDEKCSEFTEDSRWKYGFSTLIHELGHALGAMHEHGHPNSDKRIKPIGSASFESGGTGITRFDIKSVMLYCWAFKEKNSPKDSVCGPLGNDRPTVLSAKDVDGFQTLYANQIKRRNSGASSARVEMVTNATPTPTPATVSKNPIPSAGTTANKSSSTTINTNTASKSANTGGQKTQPGVSTNSGGSVSCTKFSRSPVNGVGSTCSDACRSQLRSAAQVVKLGVPGNLDKIGVASAFYQKIRDTGARQGCDPLQGTRFK